MILKLIIFRLFVVTTLLLASLRVYAQEVLGKTQYRFHYEYAWEFDTLTLNDTRKDLIILQVGQNVSKSYSYYTYQSDSLTDTPDGERVRRDIYSNYTRARMENRELPKSVVRRRSPTIVYKNYPVNQVTVTDNINDNFYIYWEEPHPQTWQITDSTKTILDYTCQMAVSDFRGRRWIAWFAHDIPISDGPWKFSGLPGLIMEVYDSEKHFHFTLVGLEQVEDEPIVFSPVVLSYNTYGEYEKTARIDLLRAVARYRGMASSIMNAELGRETFDESRSNVRHNDLMERDYR